MNKEINDKIDRLLYLKRFSTKEECDIIDEKIASLIRNVPFFEVTDEIDKILAQANQQEFHGN